MLRNKIIATVFTSAIVVLVALILSIGTLPFHSAYASEKSSQHSLSVKPIFKTATDANLTLPFLSEDRYMVMPFSLPNTSGQCGEDSGVSC